MMNLMNDMDLSIIIPAYNSKATINNTLNSIKNQLLSIKFEVIIVNDCSDYNYENFINKYKKYYNIREIKTEKNSGPGIARQVGIDNSDSKYIIFIDSDDNFYDENSISKMYNKIENENLDLVVCNFLYNKRGKKKIISEDSNWLHGKIYSREFLKKSNIKFNNTRANEDNGFNKLILFLNPKYAILNELVYVYNENSNSITSKNKSIYKFEGLEGFCYNMHWAIKEAMDRNIPKKKFYFFSLDVLSSLYVYYVSFYNEFKVDKIFVWGKPIYNLYKRQNCIPEDLINKVLSMRKQQLIDFYKKKSCDISFEEFLNKFEDEILTKKI